MKSINTNELLVPRGEQYTERNYTLVAPSKLTGKPARPYTGLTRIHIRYNKYYKQYTVRSYASAANLIQNIVTFQIPKTYNLDHIIDTLLNSHGFRIVT